MLPRGCCRRSTERQAARSARKHGCRQQRGRRRRVAARDSHAGVVPETSQQEALEESRELDKRVAFVEDLAACQRELEVAGDRLVVLEVMASDVCETGLFEVDDGWSPDQEEKEKARLQACESIKHQYVRMAGDSPNVRFLEYLEDQDGDSELCEHFGIDTFPTVLFLKNRKVVWRVSGSAEMADNMSEGLVYFSESPQLKSAEHVSELTTAAEHERFMGADPRAAKVVMFTEEMCTPCIHVYPTYVTLAMNFEGLLDFARLDNDGSPEVEAVFKAARIKEVPTFVLYVNGKEVSRDVSSHRGDLIGHILQTAVKMGIDPPRPKKR